MGAGFSVWMGSVVSHLESKISLRLWTSKTNTVIFRERMFWSAQVGYLRAAASPSISKRPTQASVPSTFKCLPPVTHIRKSFNEAIEQSEIWNRQIILMATKVKSCEMHSPLIYLLFTSIRLLHLAIPATLPLQPVINLPFSSSHPGLPFPQILKYYEPKTVHRHLRR